MNLVTLALMKKDPFLHFNIPNNLTKRWAYRDVSAKMFYVLRYTIALKTLSLSQLNMYQNKTCTSGWVTKDS